MFIRETTPLFLQRKKTFFQFFLCCENLNKFDRNSILLSRKFVLFMRLFRFKFSVVHKSTFNPYVNNEQKNIVNDILNFENITNKYK